MLNVECWVASRIICETFSMSQGRKPNSTFNTQHSTLKNRNNRYKTNKKWKKDCTVQPMSTMRVA